LIAVVAAYALLVATIALAGRGERARELARAIPELVLTYGRVARDPQVPWRLRLPLYGLVAYLLLPFDLVPDFIPVAGQLDDAVIAWLVLRFVARRLDPAALERARSGTEPAGSRGQ